MKCLHGEPCAHSTTENGSFWFCNQARSCNFFCSFGPENEAKLFEKAIAAWKATNTTQPICYEHGKFTKMCVVKDLMKANYGRPFFVCSNKAKPCSFWTWDDVKPIAKPNCSHNIPCAIRKVKKEGKNKDRLFFNCSKNKEDWCTYFEWVPKEEEEKQKTNRHTGFARYSEWLGEEQPNRRMDIINPIPFKDGFCGTVLF